MIEMIKEVLSCELQDYSEEDADRIVYGFMEAIVCELVDTYKGDLLPTPKFCVDKSISKRME